MKIVALGYVMYLFIVNPLSGNGQACSLWDEIEKKLKQKNREYSVIVSDSEVTARKFITTYLQSTTIHAVTVIGGDGTMSSVIQDIAGTGIPLAILPAGSGNDTARMFRLTTHPDQFIKGLLEHRTVAIDLLNINDRFGITVAGIGLDAKIGQRVNHSFYKPILNKLGLSSFTYTIAAIIELLSFKPFKSTVTIDDMTYTYAITWLTACGNTSSYGGGLVVCPGASPTDSMLNITMLHDVGRMNILMRLFPALLRGQPILRKGVTYRTGKEITTETDRPILAIIDGEVIMSTPLHVAIHEKALNLILTR